MSCNTVNIKTKYIISADLSYIMERSKLSQLEYKVLQMLREDGRRSASSIAKELSVSRATVAKVIKSLKDKGVKFTVDYQEEGELILFLISRQCIEGSAECYKLIDGKYISLVRGKLHEIEEILSKVEDEKEYFISTQKVNTVTVIRGELRCDYCGGEIRGDPITFKLGKRIYYTCCRTCEKELRKRLSKTNG